MDRAEDIIRLISFIDYQIDKGEYSSSIMNPVIKYLKTYLREMLINDEN